MGYVKNIVLSYHKSSKLEHTLCTAFNLITLCIINHCHFDVYCRLHQFNSEVLVVLGMITTKDSSQFVGTDHVSTAPQHTTTTNIITINPTETIPTITKSTASYTTTGTTQSTTSATTLPTTTGKTLSTTSATTVPTTTGTTQSTTSATTGPTSTGTTQTTTSATTVATTTGTTQTTTSAT